jgi:gamma-glutamyltranspeptidase/glutathione hydrolase
VVEPYSSGLGGGGFWLLHRASDNHQVMLDARETAPAAVTLAMYLDGSGKPVAGATLQGGSAAGIPGAPAGIAQLAQNYGRLPLARTLAPAIALARHGFPVDPRYARIARLRERFLLGGVNTARTFLADNQAPQPGYLLRQPQLALTLELIAQQGRDGFYRGRVAQALVAAVNATGGAWSLTDLENYRVVERAPVRISYRGATIITAALPSGGGVTLAQALNILEQYPAVDARDPAGAHLVIEALRRAFQDRALFLGDSDFVAVPTAKLISKSYARNRAATIDPAAATPSERLAVAVAGESGNTTHYSVIDADGNRVGATLSINFLFGAGVVAGDTGVLLNNEMDDFSLRPEIPNAYRLRSGEANRIEPRKRPLSSMTPTFVEDARGVLVLGAPGGSRIISQVLLCILDYVNQREVDLRRMVAAPRYHHQYSPDRVEIEPDGFPAEWRSALEARHHALQITGRKWGNMQLAFKSKTGGAAQAASDPRGQDIGWY